MAAPMNKKMFFKCHSIFRRNLPLLQQWHAINRLDEGSSINLYSTKSSPTQYCLDLVKKSDYENYVCTLLYHKDYRTSAMALRALYIELAQVQDVTSDKMRAIMRLQFWKDTIDNMFKGTPPETPVAIAASRAIAKHKLSKIWFTRILEERAKQVDQDMNRTVKNVEDSAENTVSALTYLLLECAGIKDVNADHAASHIGRCQGLVTLLRATAYHASKNKVYIPIELLIKHNVSQEQILRCKEDQNVKDVMYDIACVAHSHLETARALKDVPKGAYPILLNTYICDKYLKDLQLADFNVFDTRLHIRNQKLAWHLWKQKNIYRTF
ncbi:NADH dehydrogenase (ubiquinone) complex I, assembly factor 6-like [Ruditapes philippinarum]|uniref:NADH dehydrogenase (ubiquinone) complex I, assembly factor 6-like n=1 Tax=Ruditapes philippinarum TaxID=129788 RepID=UPI00295C3362|nr:NADH dehydrogenase (ubiquinone) complex I, assembly factor 6-like [Ruditapes philippinarum]